MFKFRISEKTVKSSNNRWAYLIDTTDECKHFLKSVYDIDVNKENYGKWFIADDYAQWICESDRFVFYYDIVSVESVYNKPEHGATNFNGETPTCAGMHTGECKCSTSKKPIEIKDQNFPVSISVSCSKENGFFMSVDFANGNEE